MLKCGYTFSLWLDSQGAVRLGGSFVAKEKEKKMYLPKQIDFQSPILSIACGLYHALCFDAENSVWSIGQNTYGQLGIGNTTPYMKQPQRVEIDNISSIHCGGYHSICLNMDGKVFVFGRNNRAQLGTGETSINENFPVLNPYLKDICDIQCGAFHTFCRDNYGNFFCFGCNQYNQLGMPSESSLIAVPEKFQRDINIQFFGCGYIHTVLCDYDGNVYTFGHYGQGRLGIGVRTSPTSTPQRTSLKNIIKISVCAQHTLCIDDKGDLWVFGFNRYGQLGLADICDRYEPVRNNFISGCVDLSEGSYHSAVKDDSGDVWVFGWNAQRQLSIGDVEANVSVPVKFEEPSYWGTRFRGKSARK